MFDCLYLNDSQEPGLRVGGENDVFIGDVEVILDDLEALIGDDVFHAAGIFIGGVLVDAHLHEHVGQDDLTLVETCGDFPAGLGQGDGLVFMERDVPGLSQDGDGPADTGFREPHEFADVNGMNGGLLERKTQDGLEVHLAGFLQFHVQTSFFRFTEKG